MGLSSYEWTFDSREALLAEALEDATSLITNVLEKTADDFRDEDPAISADAYYWVVSPRSELYSDVAVNFGLDLKYSMVRTWFAEKGIDLPVAPIHRIVLDTDDSSSWCYCEMVEGYAQALLAQTNAAIGVMVAQVNGVQIEVVGSGSRILRQFLDHVSNLLAVPPRRGFSRIRYLEKVMGHHA